MSADENECCETTFFGALFFVGGGYGQKVLCFLLG